MCNCGRILDDVGIVNPDWMARSETKSRRGSCSSDEDHAGELPGEIGMAELEARQIGERPKSDVGDASLFAQGRCQGLACFGFASEIFVGFRAGINRASRLEFRDKRV